MNTLLTGWKQLFDNLTLRQKVLTAAAILLVLAGLTGLTRWKKEQDLKPLYTGMAAEDAGAIIEKLKESGTEYKVTENGASILVPSARVSELRVQMASAGLPKTGRIGFELFDKANLGATDFAEQVNYRRALEGELERTIKSIAEVEQARVHLTFPKDSVFLENKLPAKASVLLKLRSGVILTQPNVLAISHMVSSAVEGLTPGAVAVLDIHGNLLSRPIRTDAAESSEASIEYRQKIERDLLAKINFTLGPLLGADKFRVGVSVDCDLTSGEQSEETYDPEKSVMLSSQKTEESTTGATGGGIPGTASNLPRPPARSGGSTGVSRRTENIAYQSSKTVRRIHLAQGNVKRISASVLLDQGVRWEGKGNAMKRVLVPPSADSLRAIREVVSGAIGFVPSRGDQLIIETLPFESTLQAPAPSEGLNPVGQAPPATGAPLNPVWIGGAVAGLLAIIAGLFLVLKSKKKPSVSSVPVLAAGDAEATASLDSASDDVRQLAGEIDSAKRISPELRMKELLDGIRGSVNDDSALAANVLRSWLEESKVK